MPTYEYQCTKCGNVFELFQQITERPKRTVKSECKNCDCDAPVVRLIGSGAGVLFKGDGFYETDYRSDSYKKAAKAEKEARTSTSSDAKDKTKPDTTKRTTSGGQTAKKKSKGGGDTKAA